MSTARVYNRRPVAHRTPRQRETAHRIERLIGVVAPALDLLLFAGDRLARVAGRNQVDPEPPRRLGGRGERTPLGGPPGASGRRD
jgi:hypothetical protein